MAVENKLFELYQLKQLLLPNQLPNLWLAKVLANENQLVIIQLIPTNPDLLQNPQTNEAFERQLQTSKQLNHPSILPLIDYGRTSGYFYLVQPCPTGSNLEQKLRQGQLPQAFALALFQQLLEAVTFAHHSKIIHGNLNPACLWLQEEERLLVAGFGTAKIEKDFGAVPAEQITLRSNPYLAPEQLLGYSDYRSDLYALGVILHHLLTNRLPFSETSFSKQHNGPLPDPQIPLPLELVITRALQKQPGERFSTIDEMSQAFNKAIRSNKENNRENSKEAVTAALPNLLPNKPVSTPSLVLDKDKTTSDKIAASATPSNSSPPLTLEKPVAEASFNYENAVTAPYSFSTLFDESNVPGIDGLAVFQPAFSQSRNKAGRQRGWPILMVLIILFLLLAAIGLAVLVVILSVPYKA